MELLPGAPAPVLSSRPGQPSPVPSGLPATPPAHERTQVGVSEHSYLRMGRSPPCNARSGLPSTRVSSVLLEGPLLRDHCPWGSRGCGLSKPTSLSVQWEGQARTQAMGTRHSQCWEPAVTRGVGRMPTGTQAASAGMHARPPPPSGQPWLGLSGQPARVVVARGTVPGDKGTSGDHPSWPIERPSQAGPAAAGEPSHVAGRGALCWPHSESARGWPLQPGQQS